jgi:hypothetical protein
MTKPHSLNKIKSFTGGLIDIISLFKFHPDSFRSLKKLRLSSWEEYDSKNDVYSFNEFEKIILNNLKNTIEDLHINYNVKKCEDQVINVPPYLKNFSITFHKDNDNNTKIDLNHSSNLKSLIITGKSVKLINLSGAQNLKKVALKKIVTEF